MGLIDVIGVVAIVAVFALFVLSFWLLLVLFVGAAVMEASKEGGRDGK